MYCQFPQSQDNSILGITDDLGWYRRDFSVREGINFIIRNRNQVDVQLKVDGLPIELKPAQLTAATAFHPLEITKAETIFSALLFNHAFYCLTDHDAEIGYNGILCYGTQDIPPATLPDESAPNSRCDGRSC